MPTPADPSVAEPPDRNFAGSTADPGADASTDRDVATTAERVARSRRVADVAAGLFHRLVGRGVEREPARRFVLRCVVGLFAEDLRLLPAGAFRGRLAAPREVAAPLALAGASFKHHDRVVPDPAELDLLRAAADADWSRIDPAIFGALFERSMDPDARHAHGAHFTPESEISKVVEPTILRPWTARIAAAATPARLHALHAELLAFRVLDPACGCGDFLLVAYRALRRLERRLLARLRHEFAAPADPRVCPAQLLGIDIDPFAAELARLTLRMAHLQSASAPGDADAEILVADALLTPWPAADAIVGNPPFLDARKLTRERPDLDRAALRRAFPGVPGRADLCVYWLRKAHDHLRDGQRAGFVATNTIRQNYSREGGLDHILAHGGVITDAVATQVWSGDAAVHVSIVNWVKGPYTGPCALASQIGDVADGPFHRQSVPRISSSLSAATDVADARPLRCSARAFCFEGIQPGHRGFRITADERRALPEPEAALVAPYMNGDDLLSGAYVAAPEYLIDLRSPTLAEAAAHPALLAHLGRTVLPDWRADAELERARTGKPTGEHQNRLKLWWRLKRPRRELQGALASLPRYIVCSRVTKRPIFAFLSAAIKPDSSLIVFAAADDYSFGVLQSSVHWAWFRARCSTLKGDCRYTSNTVFDAFAWPQAPTAAQVEAVAAAAVALRAARAAAMTRERPSLRALHRLLEAAEGHPLRRAQDDLDAAVRAAYGLRADDDPLAFLLRANHALADAERRGEPVTGPGLPLADPARFVTADCVAV